MGVQVQKDEGAFKKAYRRTGSIRASKLAAGYSISVANKGFHELPHKLQQYVLRRRKSLDKLRILGASVTAEEQEDIARGALFTNLANGKDNAVNTIRLTMQDKRVSMLQSDQQTGIIVIQPPPAMMQAIQERIQAMTTIPAPSMITSLDVVDNTTHTIVDATVASRAK